MKVSFTCHLLTKSSTKISTSLESPNGKEKKSKQMNLTFFDSQADGLVHEEKRKMEASLELKIAQRYERPHLKAPIVRMKKKREKKPLL